MAVANPKTTPTAPSGDHQGVKIFTYPKIIFIWPSIVVALICGIVMAAIRDNTTDPTKDTVAIARAAGKAEAANVKADLDGVPRSPQAQAVRRFTSTVNLLGLTFLAVFALNMLIMAIDFPRFTIIAIILFGAFLVFFLLWINVYFEIVPPLVKFLENIFVAANSAFYFLFATIGLVIFGIIWATRYLDFWVILPNEILHNHGPFSDLERFPTFNLKFDKEIPDILEYALLRSGRLVLHVANERRAIVLDNVLWIETKEERLKQLMRTMEVRVATDQEMVDS